jgi:hypothetical protein
MNCWGFSRGFRTASCALRSIGSRRSLLVTFAKWVTTGSPTRRLKLPLSKKKPSLMEMLQLHAPSFLVGPWAEVVIENGQLHLQSVTCNGGFMLSSTCTYRVHVPMLRGSEMSHRASTIELLPADWSPTTTNFGSDFKVALILSSSNLRAS